MFRPNQTNETVHYQIPVSKYFQEKYFIKKKSNPTCNSLRGMKEEWTKNQVNVNKLEQYWLYQKSNVSFREQ